MIYSVYDTDRKVFEYFEGPGPKGTHAGSPAVRGRSQLGSAPEQASWTLPVAAAKIGEGPLPRGRIASRVSAIDLGALGDTDPVHLGIGVALAYLAWRYLR